MNVLWAIMNATKMRNASIQLVSESPKFGQFYSIFPHPQLDILVVANRDGPIQVRIRQITLAETADEVNKTFNKFPKIYKIFCRRSMP